MSIVDQLHDDEIEAEHLDWRELITINDGAPDAIAALTGACNEYFRPFAMPSSERGRPCLNCGKPLCPDLMTSFTQNIGFTWGVVHGSGHCRNCGWPARAYHFIKDKDGKELATLRGVILQYHPDFVNRRPAQTEEK